MLDQFRVFLAKLWASYAPRFTLDPDRDWEHVDFAEKIMPDALRLFVKARRAHECDRSPMFLTGMRCFAERIIRL